MKLTHSKEFQLVDVSTRGFLFVTSSTVSDARVDLLIWSKELCILLCCSYTQPCSLHWKLNISSYVEMMSMVCEAHLWCRGRDG